MSKHNVLWDTVETIHPRDPTVTPLGPTVLKQTQCLLLSKPPTRNLLKQFCSNKPPLTQKDYGALLKLLEKEGMPAHFHPSFQLAEGGGT